ncbi:MAG: molybdopterin-binding protein, partial [Bryobacteraceae bacterium]|nr:molybdopterin-binding protein [Bryobacteraceae bacterium]
MKRHLSRRSLIAGAAGIGGASLAATNASWPPACRGVFGVSDALTYAAHRALLSHQPPAREFGREMIT